MKTCSVNWFLLQHWTWHISFFGVFWQPTGWKYHRLNQWIFKVDCSYHTARFVFKFWVNQRSTIRSNWTIINTTEQITLSLSQGKVFLQIQHNYILKLPRKIIYISVIHGSIQTLFVINNESVVQDRIFENIDMKPGIKQCFFKLLLKDV